MVKERLKMLAAVAAVALALLLFAMPAIIPIHDYVRYQGRAKGEIVAVERAGERCAPIARFEVEGKAYYSRGVKRVACKEQGIVTIHYDQARPQRNSQDLTIPIIYSVLFFTAIISGLLAYGFRLWQLRKG